MISFHRPPKRRRGKRFCGRAIKMGYSPASTRALALSLSIPLYLSLSLSISSSHFPIVIKLRSALLQCAELGVVSVARLLSTTTTTRTWHTLPSYIHGRLTSTPPPPPPMSVSPTPHMCHHHMSTPPRPRDANLCIERSRSGPMALVWMLRLHICFFVASSRRASKPTQHCSGESMAA